MIFTNPNGAPELACDECGCRWIDGMTGTCYECGTPIPPEAREAFRRTLAEFAARRSAPTSGAKEPR